MAQFRVANEDLYIVSMRRRSRSDMAEGSSAYTRSSSTTSPRATYPTRQLSMAYEWPRRRSMLSAVKKRYEPRKLYSNFLMTNGKVIVHSRGMHECCWRRHFE